MMEKRINIIGSGLAGLSLSIFLARNDISSNLISNMPSERAQSVLAEGGINAALNTMGEDDNIENHFLDTKKGGAFLEPDDNIKNLVNNAPDIVLELSKLGVPFQYESGKILLRNFGGQKKKRTAYAKSSTGKMIMTALIDEARKYEDKGLIKRYPHHECIDAKIINDKLESIIIKDLYTGEYYNISGKTVLATGGLNGFFDGYVTGSNLNNALIDAKLFSMGLEFKNLEFIQYHPTTIDIGSKRLLISEAARGEGARLMVYKEGKPYYFMEDMHPLGNLAPRDIISKTEYMIINDPKYDDIIYLDMRNISQDAWVEKLPDLRKEIKDYLNLDPKNDLIAVSPGIHFFMGGIAVDINHKTNIENLYAIGEAASIYHGANRLGGNSMLGAICGGKILASVLKDEDSFLECAINKINYEEDIIDKEIDLKLKYILLDSLGIIRNDNALSAGIDKINELISNSVNKITKAKLILAKAMIESAKNRCESRGAHQRSDYPDTLDKYLKQSIARYINDEIVIDLR